MAGLGRRTHYRKHLTDAVLHDLPEPASNEVIAKIAATRGGNQFDIFTPMLPQTPQLAILPTKFHKLVWVKRNDYVIVQGAEKEDDAVESSAGIRFIINHILYKEQIKHLKSIGLWPKEFQDNTQTDNDEENEREDEGEENQDETSPELQLQADEDDGIVYDQGYDLDDDILVANTNRIAVLNLDDDDDESCSEEEEDG